MQNDGASFRLYGITPKGGKLHISTGGNEADLSPRLEADILNPHLQKTDVHIEPTVDSALPQHLPASWVHEDEWYVFFSQPKGAQVISYINGNKIIPNGNMLWMKDKNFGMGNYHPVAWYRSVGKGKTFYTSMGHSKEVWQEAPVVRLVENAIQWLMK